MPSLVAWAPGRVNLIGEHTDYSGGLVVPAAIQLGVELRVDRVQDEISLVSEQLGVGRAFAPDGSGQPVDGWVRYAQGVAAELDALGRPPVGIAGQVASDLPIGAGLASSAALVVAVALALCAVADFELEPLELALACRRAEARATGVELGILDHAASLLAREGHALFLDCGTLEHRLVAIPPAAVLVVVDSGIAHDHAASGYAERRGELEAGMPQRVRHVETENARVSAFVSALERGDLAACGALLLESHASLRDDYAVSLPEIDRLVERVVETGALGARIVGGGFGGAILALAHETDAGRVVGSFSESHRAFVARASGGARVG